MRKSAALLMALVLSVGCNAPPPSLNLAAPYGAARVPPPGTGSFARPDSYYQPSARPGLSADGNSAVYAANERANRSSPAAVSVAPAPANDAATGGGVRLVSMDETSSSHRADSRTAKVAPAPAADPAVRIVESPAATSAAAPQLKGMSVNDATRAAEPRAFVAPSQMQDLSQFPRASSATSPATGGATPTGQATPPTSGSTAPGWKTRDDPSMGRVAGR